MTYRQRLARLEAKSDLRHPKEQKVILLNFIGPDGPDDADFATTRPPSLSSPSRRDRCNDSRAGLR